MKRIIKGLPDMFYLDKHFNELLDKITKGIIRDKKKYQDINADNREIRDIVFDTLIAIRPKAKKVNGKIILY